MHTILYLYSICNPLYMYLCITFIIILLKYPPNGSICYDNSIIVVESIIACHHLEREAAGVEERLQQLLEEKELVSKHLQEQREKKIEVCILIVLFGYTYCIMYHIYIML